MFTIITYRNNLDEDPTVTAVKDKIIALRMYRADLFRRPFFCQLQHTEGIVIRVVAVYMKGRAETNVSLREITHPEIIHLTAENPKAGDVTPLSPVG